MNLARFPRRRYTEGYTPIEYLPRLTQALGGPAIHIKRDDLLGLTAGGNKARKLEFLVADALAKGADTLVTCGAIQSNHCRMTAAAAVREGLKCRLVLTEVVPGSYSPDASGNVLLYNLLGAESIEIVPWGTDLAAATAAAAEEAAAEGRRPYIIPMGGSSPLGALGYVACAQEIMAQSFAAGTPYSHIVVAAGSAGTQAGLLVGLAGSYCAIPAIGICVLHPAEKQRTLTADLARRTADYLGVDLAFDAAAVTCYDDYLGEGYTLPTAGMIEAVKLLARTEGILLDPSYTGKAMAGLIDLVRRGRFSPRDNVLFLHTGGAPSLYAHPGLFTGH